MRTRFWLASVLVGLVPLDALPGEGRIEIDQTCATGEGCLTGDSPGFPVDITEPGSYVLTSELAHDPALHGSVEIVRLLADDVALDLNGFTIRSTSSCEVGACDIGSVDGIDSSSARRATIRNGRVVGVDGNCIRVASHALVEDVVVSHCGNLGISVGESSIVRSCRVTSTGRTGLHSSALFEPPGTIYRDCTFARNGIRGETLLPDMSAAVARALRAAGPTACDDGTCGNGLRRYYLTTTRHSGREALAACDGGFHFASLIELSDLSQLSYDIRRGVTRQDSGAGPPTKPVGGTSADGFIRTGGDEDISTFPGPGPGEANCSLWTSDQGATDTDNADPGTVMHLDDRFVPALGTGSCESNRVWCLED